MKQLQVISTTFTNPCYWSNAFYPEHLDRWYCGAFKPQKTATFKFFRWLSSTYHQLTETLLRKLEGEVVFEFMFRLRRLLCRHLALLFGGRPWGRYRTGRVPWGHLTGGQSFDQSLFNRKNDSNHITCSNYRFYRSKIRLICRSISPADSQID